MVDRAPKVSLYLLCKTPEGWKRYPAAIGRNNKVRPGYAQLGAAQKQFEGGKYQLRWVIEGKTFGESVGDDATFARAAQDTKQKTLATVPCLSLSSFRAEATAWPRSCNVFIIDIYA